MEDRQLELIEEKFGEAVGRLAGRRDAFLGPMRGLPAEEELCMKFLIGFAPVSDLASLDGELLLKFVKSALLARETLPWGRSVPEDVFLNYVLFYRVNNEAIEDCRTPFYRELFPRVRDRSMADAALEVNYWCCEKAAYRPSDERTASPLAVVRTGLGRCGEESVLAVSAFRSVGIPARQCYVPRWSHCDDNHAWAEVWIDGSWHYLGACEPEPVLDRGWFTYAATRAMLIRCYEFSTLTPKDAEGVLAQNSHLTEVNRLPAYAETKRLAVTVLEEGGRPPAGAKVRFEVLNEAELFPVAELTSDSDGRASITTGLGDLIVRAVSGGRYRSRKACAAETECVLDFSAPQEERPCDFDVVPPEGKILPERKTGESEAAGHLRLLREAEAVRAGAQRSFFDAASARRYAERFPEFREEIADFLVKARGNRAEVERFLTADSRLSLRVGLLKCLTEKDFGDLDARVLEDHLNRAEGYRGSCPDDLFFQSVLCPRIAAEPIVPYRGFLLEFFSEEQKRSFRAAPSRIAAYLEENVRDCGDLDYGTLIADPRGLLQLCVGSGRSRAVLFVAVCRTLGVPARLNPVSGEPEYFAEGWRAADGSPVRPLSRLLLTGPGVDPAACGAARLEDGTFSAVRPEARPAAGGLALSVPAGRYRILSARRQIDGTIFAGARFAEVPEGGTAEVPVVPRKDDFASRLKRLPVRDAGLVGEDGAGTSLRRILSQGGPCILAVLEIGREPTEHLLRELLELGERFAERRIPIRLVVPDRDAMGNELVCGILKAVPGSGVFRPAHPGLAEELFADLRAGDHRLPLSAVFDGEGNGKFAFSNYNIGTAALLLSVAGCVR